MKISTRAANDSLCQLFRCTSGGCAAALKFGVLWQRHSFRSRTRKPVMGPLNTSIGPGLALLEHFRCTKAAAVPPHSKFGVLWQRHSFRIANVCSDGPLNTIHWSRTSLCSNSFAAQSCGCAAALQNLECCGNATALESQPSAVWALEHRALVQRTSLCSNTFAAQKRRLCCRTPNSLHKAALCCRTPIKPRWG